MAHINRHMEPGIEFIYKSLTPDESPLVLGVVGSTAYGLATENSGKDYLGVHYVATEKLYGFGATELLKTTRTGSLPDFASHEVAKFINLCMGGNPTVLEILWLEQYEYLSSSFRELINLRHCFLSTKRVKAAYGGYVLQQAKRLLNRSSEDGPGGFDPKLKKRTAKHGRHCFRLLSQGMNLLQTGEIVINVSEHKEFLFNAGETAENNPQGFYEAVRKQIAVMDNIDSVLPDHADRERLESWLVKFRKEQYDQ